MNCKNKKSDGASLHRFFLFLQAVRCQTAQCVRSVIRRLFYDFFGNFVTTNHDVKTVGGFCYAYTLKVVVNGSYV